MKENELRKELELVSASKSSKRVFNVAIIVIIVTSVMHIVHYVFLNKQIDNLESRIVYIDSNGMTGSGEIKSMKDVDVLKIQLRAAIEYAVPYLYSFNSANYDEQIEHGLLVFGKSGKQIHQAYINDNVRENVFNNNLEVICKINEVVVNVSNGNKATVKFTQTVENGNVSQDRKFTAELNLIKTEISDSNPFGYLIENWVIINEER